MLPLELEVVDQRTVAVVEASRLAEALDVDNAIALRIVLVDPL